MRPLPLEREENPPSGIVILDSGVGHFQEDTVLALQSPEIRDMFSNGLCRRRVLNLCMNVYVVDVSPGIDADQTCQLTFSLLLSVCSKERRHIQIGCEINEVCRYPVV